MRLATAASILLATLLLPALAILSAACSSCGRHGRGETRQCQRLSAGSHQAPYFALEGGGNADKNLNLDLRVHLPLRDEMGLDALLEALYNPNSAQYLKFLTVEEFASRFHPTATHLAAVRDHLTRSGLEVDGASHGAMVVARGNVAAAEAAFGVNLKRFRTARGGHHIAPDGPIGSPTMPPILAVHGLAGHSERVNHAIMDARAEGPSPARSGIGFSAADIRRAYELPPDLTAHGETIGFVQLDGFLDADLDAYARANSLRRVPTERVLIGRHDGKPQGDGQVEVTMDLELANALAPDAEKFVVYTAANTPGGWYDMLNEIANPRRYRGPLVKYISCSWGTPEDQMTPAGITGESQFLKQMFAQGQIFVAASGDSGSKADGRHVGTDSPGSSPYALSCGGTSMRLDGLRNRASEEAWSGSGGGVSCYWPNPSWLKVRFGVPSLDSGRNVPDIALHADVNGPSGSYATIINGSIVTVGGTSCAAPLWTALAAGVGSVRRANKKQELGNIAPHLHRLGVGPDGEKVFFHIDQGCNGDYVSSPDTDFDNVCGWGSPRGKSLVNKLSKM